MGIPNRCGCCLVLNRRCSRSYVRSCNSIVVHVKLGSSASLCSHRFSSHNKVCWNELDSSRREMQSKRNGTDTSTDGHHPKLHKSVSDMSLGTNTPPF
ncbi:hypothetical protein M758_7G074200 [Ceratodon purpureus]|nr:hypothetical protein M758_7G074200 [Ceratodon purpureus]